jgi:hypothetical protein
MCTCIIEEDIPHAGHIGLPGKHAGAPIYFRNLKIKTLE